MGRRVFACASAAALIASVVVGFGSSAGAVPVLDGVGLANVGAVHYTTGLNGRGFVTIDSVYLTGRLTLGGDTYQGPLHLASMHGATRPEVPCQSVYGCGFGVSLGTPYYLSTSLVSFYGKNGTDRVDGYCHGGLWGGDVGNVLATHCNASFNQGTPHPFDIAITQLTDGVGNVDGFYCVNASPMCDPIMIGVGVDSPIGPP